MKYNEQVFRDMPSSEKIEIIKNELNLATHNATTKADLLMMLGWMYEEYISGNQDADGNCSEELSADWRYCPNCNRWFDDGLRTAKDDRWAN